MRQKVLLLMLATVFAFASSFAQTKKDVRLPKKVQETLTEMQKSSRKNQSAKTLQRQTDLSRQEGMRTIHHHRPARRRIENLCPQLPLVLCHDVWPRNGRRNWRCRQRSICR